MKTQAIFCSRFIPVTTKDVYIINQLANQYDKLTIYIEYHISKDTNLFDTYSIKPISKEWRKRWLTQITKELPTVEIAYYDLAQPIEIDKQADLFLAKQSLLPEILDLTDYKQKKFIQANGLHLAESLQILKEGIYANWEQIPKYVQPFFVKTVAIVGTESTGKSTLIRQLAQIFNTSFAEEYGRLICEELGDSDAILFDDDYDRIAYEQKVLEYKAIEIANKVVFFDTEAFVTNYYSKLYINRDNPIVNLIAKRQHYDLWLYLEPDIQWVDDGIRKHGDQKKREENNQVLKDYLTENKVLYKTITGTYQARLDTAIKYITDLIK